MRLFHGFLAMLRLLCAVGCSNFAMENNFQISARTEDLGALDYEFALVTKPRGASCLHSSCRYGYVAFVPAVGAKLNDTLIKAGMNEAGLSCDKQTLLGSQYPERSASLDNIDAAFICQWALGGFASVAEAKEGLQKVNFVAPQPIGFADGHWAFRDSQGQGMVVEFVDGRAIAHDDHNDDGQTGFGIMTNEPTFPWQLQAIRHLKWKRSLARSAVAMPGAWYPDERFQRIFLIKSAMPKPRSGQEAIMQAVDVMNSISVPLGVIGTDSGKGEGEDDRTHFGVIYDHLNGTVYWRTASNQNLQRLRLVDARLAQGDPVTSLRISSSKLPFFHDAADAFDSSAVV